MSQETSRKHIFPTKFTKSPLKSSFGAKNTHSFPLNHPLGQLPIALEAVAFFIKVTVEYAVLNDAQPTAAVPGSDMGEVSPGIDRSDDRFKDLPRDATIKESLGRNIFGWL